jgi:hypothetical protein
MVNLKSSFFLLSLALIASRANAISGYAAGLDDTTESILGFFAGLIIQSFGKMVSND